MLVLVIGMNFQLCIFSFHWNWEKFVVSGETKSFLCWELLFPRLLLVAWISHRFFPLSSFPLWDDFLAPTAPRPSPPCLIPRGLCIAPHCLLTLFLDSCSHQEITSKQQRNPCSSTALFFLHFSNCVVDFVRVLSFIPFPSSITKVFGIKSRFVVFITQWKSKHHFSIHSGQTKSLFCYFVRQSVKLCVCRNIFLVTVLQGSPCDQWGYFCCLFFLASQFSR